MAFGANRSPRALLLDGYPDSRQACTDLFSGNGLEVEVAENLDEAREALRRRPFDAMVADLETAGQEGKRLVHLVHDLQPDLPVVVLTDQPTIETAVSALEQGAARYLVRPVSPQIVFQAVWGAIARRDRSAGQKSRQTLEPKEQELRNALDRAIDNLYMVFQPIVRWSDRRIIAYEALVRTREPSLMRPDHLFAAAEKFSMVIPMGRSIRAAVSQAIADAPEDINVFVNVHGAELADEELYSPDAPLSQVASRVVLEITERWSLDRFQDVRERVRCLRSIGFRVAVDDLGAGYAGLTSFARLRPEIVKIDMSLVRGVNQDPTRQHLIRSLNTLCTDLGICVVAEGIETAEERDALLSLGSDVLQGYLFSKPAPAFPQVEWGNWSDQAAGEPLRSPTRTYAELTDLRQQVQALVSALDSEQLAQGWDEVRRSVMTPAERLLRTLDQQMESERRSGTHVVAAEVAAADQEPLAAAS
jgi:EAL domain-containing protein (putative c-di-GMP-specific phosphodiesterase class I)/ActR/RegA family two-component response regulator